MWQVAVAAAVAGSGFLAKHIFSPNAKTMKEEDEDEDEEAQEGPQILVNSAISSLSSPNSPKTPTPKNDNSSNLPINHIEHRRAIVSPISGKGGGEDGGIFRFSSSGSRSNSKESRILGKSKSFRGVIRRKKILGRFDNLSTDQRKGGGGKRVLVCLKRRKTGKVSSGKHDDSCSKECSSFGWGLGLGIMYMMSAGKAEVSKLSSAIGETTKEVHELKSKLSSQCPQLLENIHDATNTMDAEQKLRTKQATIDQCTLDQPIKRKDINHLADSEYASSVLTEEQQLEGVEMGQLESELESELLKLPWCTMETSAHEGNIKNSLQFERCESMKPSSTAYQSGGASPAELKNKLSHLLIEQQESHILELESELNLAYSKLQEKEAELRTLKDCVRRLTEFSLSAISDEETEACREEKQSWKKQDCEENKGSATASVGMKRATDFKMCGY